MVVKELISDLIPTLKTSDTGSQALAWMDHFRVSHLPVVNHLDFLGLISDSDISAMDNPKEPIGSHPLTLFSPFLYADQHLIEGVELVARLKLTLVPVVNRQKEFLGSVTLPLLFEAFAKLSGAGQPGALLVLSMSVHDYSLAEISRIVEENGAKILNLFISTSSDTMLMEVTLKINSSDLSSIIRSFERYDYQIKASFNEDDQVESMYRNRYEAFMRYLNT
ncbi:MAG: CBS domain-containing protein [Bacteroidales bacterium]|nr:CBS domain-containing protein [Bacteroidales bacterium]